MEELIMNKARIKQLINWKKKAEELKEELESILYDEQDYFDNMPENLQGSMKGIDSEEAINQLEDAISTLEEAIDSVDNIT